MYLGIVFFILQEVEVYYQQVKPSLSNNQGTVLYLHGDHGSSQKWMDLGSMHLAARLGYEAIALDLPGLHHQ